VSRKADLKGAPCLERASCGRGVYPSVLEPWAEKIDAAAEAEDGRAYREAVRGYLNAGLNAI